VGGWVKCREVATELAGRQRPPGLSVAVLGRREEPRSDGFGVADVETQQPASAETVYLWFSMTKLVTATAVVQLAERGRLGLDDPVGAYVSRFPSGDRGRRVTIRHLLSHSAGLANPIPVGWVRPAGMPAVDLHEFTSLVLAKHSRLRSEPGARASYSNLGYLVLGEVIEAASGVSYADYVRSNILAPLGMSSSDFVYRAEMNARAATGYHPRYSAATPLLRWMVPSGIFDHRVGRLWAFSRFCVQGAPYGGLIGPVEDAAKFLRLHLDAGEASCPTVLSSEGVAVMQRPTAHGRKLDVALGWFQRHADRDSGCEVLGAPRRRCRLLQRDAHQPGVGTRPGHNGQPHKLELPTACSRDHRPSIFVTRTPRRPEPTARPYAL
jgi:CubicO group peptidase (beta-lactamase class C family)